MKRIQLLIMMLIILLMGSLAKAQIQPDPAHWAYGLKKMTNNSYEVHLQATIDTGWHIYAGTQTVNFIGTKTKISITKVPGLTVVGAVVEHGKKDTYKDKDAGITNYEYAGKVDFVQLVTVKPRLKMISGTINYQTCTHQKCLNEKTISFSVPVPNN